STTATTRPPYREQRSSHWRPGSSPAASIRSISSSNCSLEAVVGNSNTISHSGVRTRSHRLMVSPPITRPGFSVRTFWRGFVIVTFEHNLVVAVVLLLSAQDHVAGRRRTVAASVPGWSVPGPLQLAPLELSVQGLDVRNG